MTERNQDKITGGPARLTLAGGRAAGKLEVIKIIFFFSFQKKKKIIIHPVRAPFTDAECNKYVLHVHRKT